MLSFNLCQDGVFHQVNASDDLTLKNSTPAGLQNIASVVPSPLHDHKIAVLKDGSMYLLNENFAPSSVHLSLYFMFYMLL